MKFCNTENLSPNKLLQAKRLLTAPNKGYYQLAAKGNKENKWLTAVSQIAYLLKNEKPEIYAKIKEECKRKKDTKYWHLVGYTFSDIYDIIHKYDGTPFDLSEKAEFICREMLSKVIASKTKEYTRFKDEEYKKKVIQPSLDGLTAIQKEYDKQIKAILDKAKKDIINRLVSNYILSGSTLSPKELIRNVVRGEQPPTRKKYVSKNAIELNDFNIKPLINRLNECENIFDELRNIINKFKRDS